MIRQRSPELARLFLAVLLGSFFLTASAAAGDLRDFVSDLYGGSGVTLTDLTLGPAPNRDFMISSRNGLNSQGSGLALNLSFISPSYVSSGLTFDFELGTVVRVDRSLGPLIAEDATTIGAKRLDVAFSYSRVDFKRLDGDRLNDLTLVFSGRDIDGPDGGPDGVLGPLDTEFAFELDELLIDLDLEITQDVFALFATYGLGKRWDVGVVVPIIHVVARSEARGSISRACSQTSLTCVERSEALHNFGSAGDPRRSKAGGDATGIGDVILRSKIQLMRGFDPWPDLGFLAEIGLPTGDKDDLLGTGEASFKFVFIASKRYDWFTPHVNLGYQITTGSIETDSLRYLVGFDARVIKRLTVAADVVGRYAIASPTGPSARTRIGGDHLVDLAVGARLRLFRSFVANTNLQIPLNRNEGLRPDLIWTVGFDFAYGFD